MSYEKKTTRLRNLVTSKEFLLLPGCFNPLSARLVEQAGFAGAYITGAGVASNLLGYPDIGLASHGEVLSAARCIAQVTDIPMLCDTDTGFGNAVNVIRTVREFEAAGIAGIQLEDQLHPKKCGHTEGKLLVSKEEMVQKVKAAVDTRKDQDFVLVIRTDAIAVNGLDDALDRAAAYVEAGADVIFVEAPQNVEQMRRITSTIKAPLLANMVEGGGKTPILPAKELAELGYSLAIYPTALWMSSIKAMQEVLGVLKATGTSLDYAEHMVSFQEMFEIVGRSAYAELEKKYATKC
ncbi:MAG: oxaloacetate decarboxylase [Desulfovibrionaceae bacterium]|jgi:methylisocitrate lyase|nr:oxaloacetate decarboxylase [Desulfovibrionaceae bacterium]